MRHSKNQLSQYSMLIDAVALTLAVLATLHPTPLRAADLELPVGIEVEYGSNKSIESNPNLIKPTEYAKLLEMAQQHLKGSGVIQIVPHSKWPEMGWKRATLLDAEGRTWQVVPEGVNSKGWDGFELVTPPLKTEADIQNFYAIIQDVHAQGEFGKGLESSIHMTFDVSKLTDAKGDSTHLLDTILYIENHWREIYAAVNPIRYGTLVNDYSIPLAFDQREMLRDLGELRKRGTPIDKNEIKAIFLKHEPKEYALRGGEDFAWKYRSAAYRRLFGLVEGKTAPVIEFRISDFGNPVEIQKRLKLFSSIISKASILEPGAGFKDPFRAIQANSTRHELNESIAALSDQEYEHFLSQHGFGPKDFPKLEKLQGPLSHSLPEAERLAVLRAVDLAKPTSVGQRPIRYSLETHGQDSATNLGPRSRTATFKEVLAQLKTPVSSQLPKASPNELVISVPVEILNKTSEEEFSGWLRRLDQIHFFNRIAGSETSRLGTIGQMTSIRPEIGHREILIRIDINRANPTAIEELVRMILAGIDKPELIQGFAKSQERILNAPTDFVGTLDHFFQRARARPMNYQEKALATRIAKDPGFHSELPLLPMEEAPYFTHIEHQRISDARLYYLQEFSDLIYQACRPGKTQPVPEKELIPRVQSMVRRWVKRSDLPELLKRSTMMAKSLARRTCLGLTASR